MAANQVMCTPLADRLAALERRIAADISVAPDTRTCAPQTPAMAAKFDKQSQTLHAQLADVARQITEIVARVSAMEKKLVDVDSFSAPPILETAESGAGLATRVSDLEALIPGMQSLVLSQFESVVRTESLDQVTAELGRVQQAVLKITRNLSVDSAITSSLTSRVDEIERSVAANAVQASTLVSNMECIEEKCSDIEATVQEKCSDIEASVQHELMRRRSDVDQRGVRKRPSAPCKFFPLGRCTKGVGCRFVHEFDHDPRSEADDMAAQSEDDPLRESEDPDSFLCGDVAHARLQGLNQAHLNGQACTVMGFESPRNRWRVQPFGSTDTKLAKRANLVKYTPLPTDICPKCKAPFSLSAVPPCICGVNQDESA